MRENWLVLETACGSPSKVWLAESPPELAKYGESSLRFSPLFPTSSRLVSVDEAPVGTFHVGFFVLRRPVASVAKLSESERIGVYYSLGLTSIVSIRSNPEFATALRERWKDELVAHEVWQVEDGILTEPVQFKVDKGEATDFANLRIPPACQNDQDLRWILLELSHNLKRFSVFSARLLPSNSLRCDTWAACIQEMVDELAQMLETEVGEVQISAQRALHRQKQVHANTELLIHINSSLVYAISQAFYGCVPIRDTLPLMSHHSLLGIGSAWVALRNLCSFIESVFENHPVHRRIVEEFGKSDWQDPGGPFERLPDVVNDSRNAEPRCQIRPKITSFSARLGFGEIDFAATCASQTLHASASSRHNMMTMSHELLHAHVKSLVLAVFTGNETSPTPVEESICKAHQTWLKWKQKAFPQHSLRLTHTVQFGIVEYVGRYRACLALAEHYRSFGKPAPETADQSTLCSVPISTDDFRASFRASYRFLEEVIVHTLDFTYFYNSQTDLYVDAIWSSWSTVPSVLSRLEWYLLRTLSTIATSIDATGQESQITYRLDQSLAILRSRLKAMALTTTRRAIAEAASDVLDDERIEHWIKYMFIPALALADLAKAFLTDKRIAGALWSGDDFIDWRDDKMTYTLDDFIFDEQSVRNPVALLMDRLARALDAPDVLNEPDEARRSAFISLVASDHAIPKSEQL